MNCECKQCGHCQSVFAPYGGETVFSCINCGRVTRATLPPPELHPAVHEPSIFKAAAIVVFVVLFASLLLSSVAWADDTASFRASLLSGQPINLDGQHLTITEPITLDCDDCQVIDIDGGHPSRSSITFTGIEATHLQFNGIAVRIRNITINCVGTIDGPFAALHLRHCDHAELTDIVINDPDNWGILLYECHAGRVNGCRVNNSLERYEADEVGTAIQLAGCSSTRVICCESLHGNFPFSVLGKEYTDNAQSSPGELITRPVDETVGNVFGYCTADRFRGTAFNVNGANVTLFQGCVATSQHPDSGHPAYQVKHPTNAATASHNRFDSCTAQDVFSGFYAQGGSKNTFHSCSVRRSQRFAFRLNISDDCLITNCIADQFAQRDERTINGGYVVRQSDRCVIDNCIAEPAAGHPRTTALISIELDSAETLIGNFRAGGAAPMGLRIASASERTRISAGCVEALRSSWIPVVDESRTTAWGK